MSDAISQTKGVSGLRRRKDRTLHFLDPTTGRTACGHFHRDQDNVLTYRLDIGSPSFELLCRDCYRSTDFIMDLPSGVEMKYEQAISRMKAMSAGFAEMDHKIPSEKREKVGDLIEEALDQTQTPVFYAVEGSHLRETHGDDSDIDVRGFHVTPMAMYSHLDEPSSSVKVNYEDGDEHWEEFEDIDFVSYELKEYGDRILNCQPSLIESLFHGEIVMNTATKEMQELRKMVEKELPLDIPYVYYSIADSNYNHFLDPSSDSYEPTPKHYLTVLRCLLGAKFIEERDLVEARPRVMSETVLGGSSLIDSIIDFKRENGGDERLDRQLEDDAQALTLDLFESTDYERTMDEEDFKNKLNQWMMKIRTSLEDQ